nr:unnamed protein product [Haemonchus contortus]
MNICYVVLNGQSQNINFTREKTVEDWLPFLSIKVQRSTPLRLFYTWEILYGSNNSSYFSASSRAPSILCGSFNRSPLRLLYTLEILHGSINNPHFSASSRAPSNPLWLSTVDLPAATDGVVDSDVDFEERRPGWVDGSETSGFSDFAFYAATYRLAPYCTRAKA